MPTAQLGDRAGAMGRAPVKSCTRAAQARLAAYAHFYGSLLPPLLAGFARRWAPETVLHEGGARERDACPGLCFDLRYFRFIPFLPSNRTVPHRLSRTQEHQLEGGKEFAVGGKLRY